MKCTYICYNQTVNSLKQFFIYIIFLFLLNTYLFAQQDKVWLHPNKGQWHTNILYKIDLQLGEMYIEEDGFTYNLNDLKQVMSHDHGEDQNKNKSTSSHNNSKIVKHQVIKAKFKNTYWKGIKEESKPSKFYRNYFIGNNQAKWQSKIYSYGGVSLINFYKEIDLKIEGTDEFLKYSLKVKKGGNPSDISYVIEGANNVSLAKNGMLKIQNRFGEIVEGKPTAWNIKNGVKVEVPISFRLIDNNVSFYFPEGFDHNFDLMIDPSITFSTFTGSTSDNWGMTATPDHYSNLYAAGIIFNDGGDYPTTTGAFDEFINGGDSPTSTSSPSGFDIGVSKFSEDGTELLFSTYLGGSGNETAHSLVVDENDNLFIIGATSSPNFPTSQNCFDPTFNGGQQVFSNYLYFTGSDIFISKISADGSQLLAGTYVGGDENDGLNVGTLEYNFGDSFRGEIIASNDGFIYVTSTTQSSNFPTQNAFQSSLKGVQDAVVFKMDANLSALSWSSYFGGNGEESGNSIQKGDNGDLYFTGGTTSSGIAGFNGANTNYQGGLSDGYIVRLNSISGTVSNASYIGSSGYDQSYFVQLDESGNVYVYGQSDTNWPITAGLYGTPNSGQFIRKYNASLSTVSWTTMIGAGTGNPEISPTAFLVSNCDEIYIAGWGGVINQNSQAIYSSTNGFETTPDAYQSITNGSNFYLAVLTKDAESLKYGTFMGGFTSSYNHVDGGTSRFDKNGKIYHAVCAACGGQANGFSTTQGAYSTTNNSPNCNLAAFKFELNSLNVDLNAIAPKMCISDAQVFYGITDNGNAFHWDFGDGNYSDEQNPLHEYTTPGSYTVVLTISDTISCFASKTIIYPVEAIDGTIGMDTSVINICAGLEYQMNAFGGDTYSWSPSSFFSDAAISNPMVRLFQDAALSVIVENICKVDTFSYYVPLSIITPILSNDTIVCENYDVQLRIENSMAQVWTPSDFLNDPNSSMPICSPPSSVMYDVEIITLDGCVFNETVNVEVRPKTVFSVIPDELRDTSLCIGESISLSLSQTLSQEWSPQNYLNDFTISNPSASPSQSTTFYVTARTIDNCYIDDSLNITVFYTVPSPILVDTIKQCKGDTAFIVLNGAQYYDWSMNTNTNNISLSSLNYFTLEENYFYCNFINVCGDYYDSILVLPFKPEIYAGKDTTICPRGQANVWVTGTSSYEWNSSDGFSGTDSLYNVQPLVNTEYTIIGSDAIGCKDTASVQVNLFNPPYISLMDDYLAAKDELVYIDSYTNDIGQYDWIPSTFLSCDNCKNPTTAPNQNITYTVYFTDTNSCTASDEVLIFYEGVIYVPNTFTPNIDGKFNTSFRANGVNITSYHFMIFDRWGEVVFETNDFSHAWNGSFNGSECQTGTYIWKINYTDIAGDEGDLVGHVNLIR